jgi:hypothetical protein
MAHLMSDGAFQSSVNGLNEQASDRITTHLMSDGIFPRFISASNVRASTA